MTNMIYYYEIFCSMQTAPNFQNIKETAKNLRINVLTMINAAGSGHSGGSLGMADVFATLYFSGLMKYNAQDPTFVQRDTVILSNAHICPIYYATLAQAGYFDKSELMTLRKFGSRLQGHSNNHFPELGIESSGGPLGQGISVSVGFALSKKLNNIGSKVICFCSDGELNEGQAWEAFMSASKFKLDNLIFIIDRNNIQIDGISDKVMPLEPLHDKLVSFGCNVIDVQGNDVNKIYNALKLAYNPTHNNFDENEYSHGKIQQQRPTVLIMHTILGKGVSFMENNYKWHGKAPSNEDLEKALKELNV